MPADCVPLTGFRIIVLTKLIYMYVNILILKMFPAMSPKETFVSDTRKMYFTIVMWLPWFQTCSLNLQRETEQWNEKFGLNVEYFFPAVFFVCYFVIMC